MRIAGAAVSRRALLEWYEPRREAYPWRRTSDPYAVLVSECMLQQTQAARVVPAFERFLAAFPTVQALAAARVAEVIDAWDGLGYNRRAVALHRAAEAVVAEHAGVVPGDPAALRSLPGVGPYTAAAVASIAFGVGVVAVDTNVMRVVSRVVRVEGDGAIGAAAAAWLDGNDPGAWNQAVMDLGREVCRPVPRCGACLILTTCRSAGSVSTRGRRASGEPFDGSSRQLRGAVVTVLRHRRSLTLGSLANAVGRDLTSVARAVRALEADGLASVGPAALAGRASGRVALP
ncbi:MAG: A/G-specific adenine glycosylase [Actinomycetota bacterium]